MSILFANGLPCEIDGVAISPDFRNMMQLEAVLGDVALTEQQRIFVALNLLFPALETLPSLAWGMEKLQWFYGGGPQSALTNSEATQGAIPHRAYDFSKDSGMLYAAFYQTYHIRLTTIRFLHWWEFLALFQALPEEVLFKKVMYWRTCNLFHLPKPEREHVKKMRTLFALECETKTRKTVAQIEAENTLRAAERFAEVKRQWDAQQLAENAQG